MIKILIVGSGQQAKAYYQALQLCYPSMNVHVVSKSSREAPWCENKSLLDYEKLKECEMFFELIIMANAENDRLEAVTDLKDLSNRFLIEKPVCTSKEDYVQIKSKLIGKEVYIAYNRRYFHDYFALAKFLSSSKLRNITIFDQQFSGDFPKYRINQFSHKLHVANSIHSFDLVQYIFQLCGWSNISGFQDISKSDAHKNYLILSRNEIIGNYVCSMTQVGPWRILIHTDDYFIEFIGHEELKVLNCDRDVVFHSKVQNTLYKNGIKELLEGIIDDSMQSRLPNFTEDFELFSLIDGLEVNV